MEYSRVAPEDPVEQNDMGMEEGLNTTRSGTPNSATHNSLRLSPCDISFNWSSPTSLSFGHSTHTMDEHDLSHPDAAIQEQLDFEFSHGLQSDSPLLDTRDHNSTQDEVMTAPSDSFESWRNHSSLDSTSKEADEKHATKATDLESTTISPSWMPYTIRSWYMCFTLVLTTALIATVAALLVESSRNDGLATDDHSSALLFGWRFTPTLFAVAYARAIAMLYEDVRRTEPFAVLARPQGGKASSTLLQESDPWWTILRKSLMVTDGKRSWALFCACLVNVLAFLVVAPLSSSILTSMDMSITRDTEFSRFIPRTDTTIYLLARGDTFLRTISNLLQNATTSAFISGSYVVYPTWPSSMTGPPLGSRLSDTPQIWISHSLIYQLQYDCHTAEYAAIPERLTDGNMMEVIVPPSLEGSSNCSYVVNLKVEGNFLHQEGGALWTSSEFQASNTRDRNSSCNQDVDIIAIISGPRLRSSMNEYRDSTNTTSKVHICTTRVFQAEFPVTISTMATSTRIEFNEATFKEQRTEVLPTVLDISKLRQALIDPKWSNYLSRPLRGAGKGLRSDQLPVFDRAAAALGMFYDWNVTVALQAEDLPERARQIQQRLFGELLQASIIQPAASEIQKQIGSIIKTERRIVVVPQVAFAIISLLALSLMLLSILFQISRLSLRPLGLRQDPATVIGLARQFLQINPYPDIGKLSLTSRKDLGSHVKALHYRMDSRRKRIVPDNDTCKAAFGKQSALHSRWKPTSLRMWYLTTVVIYVLSLSVAVPVLYHFATRQKLYKTVFVYQATLRWFQSAVFAPYSIVPTLLAVGVGLMWDSIDKTSRRLQPFLSMARRPTPLNCGSGLSYQSTYLVWTALKAIYHRHWLLAMISTGSVVCQILVIAMSALFQREMGALERSIVASRHIEPRQMPYIAHDTYLALPGFGELGTDGVGGRIMSSMFSAAQTNWMYSATIQLTLDGFEPPWSKDGWSFLPVSLPELPDYSNASLIQVTGSSMSRSSKLVPMTNFTLITTAKRGRLECSDIPQVKNTSTWLKEVNFRQNSTRNRDTPIETAYEVTHNMFSLNYTSLLAHPGQVSCCININSNQTQAVTIGYWSATGDIQLWPNAEVPWPVNATIKWLRGLAAPWPADIETLDNVTSADFSHYHAGYMFTKIPTLQAINCRPQIESAAAEVTIDYVTGIVQSFAILEDPEPEWAPWSDPFVMRTSDRRYDPSKDGAANNYDLVDVNTSTSYGVSFFSALLGASDLSQLQGVREQVYGRDYPDEALNVTKFRDEEDFSDETFKIRDNSSGLNLDLMSYAMYTLAEKDPVALLNASTMLTLAQKVFQTYFQHFVSTNTALNSTFGAYQPIGAEPDPILGNWSMAWGHDETKWNPPTSYPRLNTSSTVNGTVTTRVEMLHMNEAATWISVVGLTWLLCTAVALLALQKRYLDPLIRDTETIAEVLVLIVGSESLLKMVNETDTRYLVKNKQIHTKLGWFRGKDSQVRWGIEIVGDVGPGAVEWLDKPVLPKEDEGD